MDALLRHLLDLGDRRIPPAARRTPGRRLAVAAVGGYGRAQLAPASDLDLLFVVPQRPSVYDIQAIEFVLYRLWDLGLRVGHGVRSCDECVGLARADWRTAISLLDLRFLWGERARYDELVRRFRAEIVGNGEILADALLCDLARRHARFRDPEAPDVKQGPGGLRDLQTLLWLAKIRGQAQPAGHAPSSGLSAADPTHLLWSVRCHLHYLTGRAEERLSTDLQPEIARRMLANAPPAQRSTAAFMRQFCRATRQIEALSARLARH
jgi:[protein-PII] uridylyltransferase